MSGVISILCPTRQRAFQFSQYYDSLINTVYRPEAVELLFYVDMDDPQLEHYKTQACIWKMQKLQPTVWCEVGPPISVSQSWNVLAAKCRGDILLMGNDDLYARTPSWDERLREVAAEYIDDIYCIFFDDGINHGKHCAFPAVSRKWYQTLKKFTPGCFEFFYNDTWIYDVAKRIDRVRYLPDVLMEHRHWTKTKKSDTTTLRHRSGPARERNARDKALFEASVTTREEEAEKLRKVMNI